MELEKLNKKVINELYKVFEDNDSFMIKEDDKYAEATNEILNIREIEDTNILRNLRNNFVYTISDLITSARELAEVDNKLNRICNIYMNMLQYVTTEIDSRIFVLEGNI